MNKRMCTCISSLFDKSRFFVHSLQYICKLDCMLISVESKSVSIISLCLIITLPLYILRVLKSCPKLKFLDVSFCSNIDNELLSSLKVAFPHVCFKKSFSD